MMKKIFLIFAIGTTYLFSCNTSNIKYRTNHTATVQKQILKSKFNKYEIDINKTITLVHQINASFSAPAVGVMLLDYYHNFKNVNQHYLAYQMRTNVGHYGTTVTDFDQFLTTMVNHSYTSRLIYQHFGDNLSAVEAFIIKTYQDLQSNILPILLMTGYLPGVGNVVNHYLIINGIYGDLEEPWKMTFEYLNTSPDNVNNIGYEVTGRQLNWLWRDGVGCYFGKEYQIL